MRKSRLFLPDEFDARARWQRRGTWCYRLSLGLGLTLLLVAAVTEGVPLVPDPHLSVIKQWMNPAVAIAMALALCGFIFSRE